MNKNSIKKRIAAGSLAVIIGSAAGIAMDRHISNKSNLPILKKNNKEVVMLYEEEYLDKSYILGGVMGHYDYINENDNDPTNNEYYQKYNNYFDRNEYNSGYVEGYQEEGMFEGLSETELLYNADITSIAFSLMEQNLIVNKYYTDDYDKAIEEVDRQLENIQEDYGFSMEDDSTNIKKSR